MGPITWTHELVLHSIILMKPILLSLRQLFKLSAYYSIFQAKVFAMREAAEIAKKCRKQHKVNNYICRKSGGYSGSNLISHYVRECP